jgi:hypothetical protein
VLVSAAVGAVIGLVWAFTAPRAVYEVAGGELQRVSAQPEEYFGADLLLGGMLAVAGLVLAIVWWVRGRNAPMGALVGLISGGLMAGFIAAWVGGFLTTTSLSAAGLADGALVTAGVRLRSWAVLVWWPTAVAVVFAVALAGSVDREREALAVTPAADQRAGGPAD